MVPESMRDMYPTRGDLRDSLRHRGIVFGIKEDILDFMAAGHICGERILVAEGQGPQPGEPGKLEFLFDTSSRGRPLESEDGSVDMRNLQMVINVSAGQPLVRRIAPTPGTQGRSVFGETIDAPVAREAEFRMGGGTKLAEEDPAVLVSAVDGAVVVSGGGYVEVIKSEIIPSDIDYTTGNVSFTGDLTIRGSVRAGFSVEAKGNLRIGGNVEEATVSCTGNLEIAGGAVGAGEGTLCCQGSLKARHIERFNVRAGRDVYVAEDAIHSIITAQGRIHAKIIVGGTASAGEGIEAEVVGAAAETRTVLDAGGTFAIMQEKQEIMKSVGALTIELTGCREAQFSLVEEALDEKGKMPAGDEEALEELWKRRCELEAHRAKLMERSTELDKKLADRPNAIIRVNKALPNTLIRFGHLGKLIKSTLLNVLFAVDQDRIKIAKF